MYNVITFIVTFCDEQPIGSAIAYLRAKVDLNASEGPLSSDMIRFIILSHDYLIPLNGVDAFPTLIPGSARRADDSER